MNIAANAVIAEQAAAARLLLAQQNLARCREENNPFLPGRNPFGVPTKLMWAPDPCTTQEKELAGATTAHADAVAAAQVSNAPTAQDLPSAPAPQLSDSWDTAATNPAIPESEFTVPNPSVQNSWSPTTVMEILDMIAQEMEAQEAGSSSNASIVEEMDTLEQNIIAFQQWWAWGPVKRTKCKFQFNPKNANWIGKWVP
ncbi:NP [avian chapparvovirus BR_DF10]|uniref:NP n=1 Tax=avian chapparvovirus BR_DF10 TaxID=3070175 RepID=A0A5C0PY02_9VIRU|nr:NP [Avian chapparvovirus]QEJ80803.1 NP [avian chapparvovirus BR_DF10]